MHAMALVLCLRVKAIFPKSLFRTKSNKAKNLYAQIYFTVTGDKISGIASQIAIQKWPSCYATLKCIATICDAFLLQLVIYINCLFMFLTL